MALNSTADELKTVEAQFRELPPEARRLVGPLFWLHGDETREQLQGELARVAEAGNGSFTAESRPHKDWLGEGWYRDLEICLESAHKHNLQMWIFDEKWWPSQGVGGKVPTRWGSKRLEASAVTVEGPGEFATNGYSGERYVAAVAGRLVGEGKVEGNSLVDLAPFIQDGKLKWTAPEGRWQIMKFTHRLGEGLGQNNQLSVDGASQDCVDWFIQTVYQPHYDRFKNDFGKTIPGFFYDEPETRGDWGADLNKTLAARKVDWKKAYVAFKFSLAGEDQQSARFQYLDAFAETWGRLMYGGMADWCQKHGVKSMGHFMEHNYLYLDPNFCAGDFMWLQRYSDLGALDLVCHQLYPGQRPVDIYQTPKLASSISHVFNKQDSLTMCEIFGGYDQKLTYPNMKWLVDQMQVRGVNFMIPHSFNPRAPRDTDYPPYFYDGGYEPRYPLYRVFADYTSRLSLLLTGGKHVCPAAILFSGNARQVGKMISPEEMTSALQDAEYDCDWLPCDVFTGQATLEKGAIALHDERYRVLIVPPVEVISYDVLAKAKAFFDTGGIVVGYGFLPSKSATVGKSSSDIVALCNDLWGTPSKPSCVAAKTSPSGGRSYFLAEKPTAADLAAALGKDAAVPPVVDVMEGDTGGWFHVLHRVKSGADTFLLCNQNHEGEARTFKLHIRAAGVPECWDAMRNEITTPSYKRVDDGVIVTLRFEPSESVLLVFRSESRPLPARLETGKPLQTIEITRDESVIEKPAPVLAPEKGLTVSAVKGNPFNGRCEMPSLPKDARVCLELDTLAPEAAARVEINGAYVGGFIGKPFRLDVTAALKPGTNKVRVTPFAPASARLAVYPR